MNKEFAPNAITTPDLACESYTIPKTEKTFSDFFSKQDWIFWVLFIAIGIIFRWVNLSDRPLHHDESLHAMWAKYYLDHPGERFYKYDPMMHGPFLYNWILGFYLTFGDSVWSARAAIASLGTASLFLPLVFRRFFSAKTVILLTGAIALSPILTYYARFCREDYVCLLGIFLTIYGLLIASDRNKSFFFFVGIAIQLCGKENSFVHLAIWVGYLLFDFLFNAIVHNRFRSIATPAINYCKKFPVQALLGFLAGVMVYVLLYSAAFNYNEGILDGLYRKSIFYWWNQSSIERIKGPFMFHIYSLAFYELPFLLLTVFVLLHFYKNASTLTKILGVISLVISVGLWVIYYHFMPEGMDQERYVRDSFILWDKLKLKSCFDIFGAVFFVLQAIIVTVEHKIKNQERLAVLGYFFGATLFSYSYLGEKVPWLTIYPLVAGMIYLAAYCDQIFTLKPFPSYRSCSLGTVFLNCGILFILFGVIFSWQQGDFKPNTWFFLLGITCFSLCLIELLVENVFKINYSGSLYSRVNALVLITIVAFILNFRSSSLTNFVYPGEAREFIGQVHTVPEAINVANDIVEEITSQRRGYLPHVWVDGEATWPITWYFRRLSTYDYINKDKRDGYLFRIEDWKDGEPAPKGFRARRIELRGWWVPDYNTVTLKNILSYYFNHEPWNGPGFSYVNLYTRLSEEGEPLKQ
jgi:uncharacterized protein (TIGR03663 family)